MEKVDTGTSEGEHRHFPRRNNDNVPLHRLPLESFISIIKTFLDDHDHNHGSRCVCDGEPTLVEKYRQHYTRLLPLRLVAIKWNTVIISTPTFWSAVPLDGLEKPSFTRWILEVSNPTLIDVAIIHNPWSKSDADLTEVVRQSSRWRSLTVSFREDSYLEKVITSPTPSLRSLSLSMANAEFELTTGEIKVPDPLFMEIIPRLESLSLDRVAIAWSAPYLKNLQSLQLFRIHIRPPSIDQLFAVMEQSPDLRELSIESCHVTGTPTSPDHVISKQLRLLHLRDVPGSFVIYLIQRVQIPDIQKLEINVNRHSEPWENLRTYYEEVTKWLVGNIPWLRGHPMTCQVEGWRHGFKWLEGTLDIVLRVVTIDRQLDKSARAQVCRHVTDLATPSWIKMGILDRSSEMEANLILYDTLLLNVTTISFSAYSQDINGAFSALQQPRDRDGKRHWLYPNLVTLSVDADSWWTEAQFPAVRELIEARRAHEDVPNGALKRLETLRISECENYGEMPTVMDKLEAMFRVGTICVVDDACK